MHFLNVWMRVEELFHLDGADVLSAAVDLVLDTTDVFHVTTFGHDYLVPGIVPPVADRLFGPVRLVVVLEEDQISTHAQLPTRVQRNGVVLAVHDFHLNVIQWFSDRVDPLIHRLIGSGNGNNRTAFGRSVQNMHPFSV